MHTNYAELSRRTLPGPLGMAVGFVSRVMNACLCAVHTHKVRPTTGCRSASPCERAKCLKCDCGRAVGHTHSILRLYLSSADLQARQCSPFAAATGDAVHAWRIGILQYIHRH